MGAAASVAAFGSVAGQTKQDDSRITIAVLRRDGFLRPFASFDDGEWSVSWPDTSNIAALPIGLGDIPKKWWGAAGPGAPWTAWLPGGVQRPLKLIAPMSIPVFCSRQLAITTDYRGDGFEFGQPTVPKDGIAIAGGASVLPIESVDPGSPDARDMVRTITEEFNKEEKNASRRFTRWTHPFPDKARREFPIEIEAFYRSSESTARGAWTTMYVEAVRKFPPGPEDTSTCGLITYARAWVRQQAGGKPDIDLGARVTYCDRANVAFMFPFGRLMLRDEVYWVYQTSSWRDELYTVARVRPKETRPVVTVSGGMCFQ